MAYSLEGTDIVIKGWEQGISDNPYEGLNDMRGVNIISVPGEASVSFAQYDTKIVSCAGSVVSADPSTEIITVTRSSGTLATYQAIVFTGASLPTGITAGTTYFVQALGDNTFSVFTSPFLEGSAVNITGTGTGTFATIDMAGIKYFERSTGVALDSNGRAWRRTSSDVFAYLGNSVSGDLANNVGNGLIWYKEYLFVFYNSRICYIKLPLGSGFYAGATWVNQWNPATGAVGAGVNVFNTLAGQDYPHDSLVGQDDVIYITDSNYLASLREKDGQVFDPANTATYTWAKQALKLPSTDRANCLEELGVNLLIGGSYNYIYPWDRISTSFKYPMKISENYVSHMLTVNTNTYIFAGRRGRILVTNGSQANEYKKMPDHISGVEPIFIWNNCCYNKNQIYFGCTAYNNSTLLPITSYSGLWAIDISTESLRCVNLQSSTTGVATAVFAYNDLVNGYGLLTAWGVPNTGTYPLEYTSVGIDASYSNARPYNTYIAYIESDLIPVGQYLKKKTFDNIEIKLAKALVNGEGVRVSVRTVKDGAYTVVGETTAVGSLSDFYTVNFDQSEWLQVKVELKSTNTTPTYTRLREIRLRSSQ